MKSIRSKLLVCALVIGAYAGVANAAQIVVFERSLDKPSQQFSAGFAVNRDLGRAWIEVQIQPPEYQFTDEPPVPEVFMSQVNGLSYDPARKQVVYRSGSETVVCAEDASFLWETYVKDTGNCQLTATTEHRKVDDGFESHDDAMAKVVLEVPISTAAQAAIFKSSNP